MEASTNGMEVSSKLNPECLGKINKWYGWRCSTLCPFTGICVLIVMDQLIRAGLLK